jgi:predicted P-loop ATPase
MARKSKKSISQRWEVVEEFITLNFDLRFNSVECVYEYKKKGGGDEWRVLNENEVFREMNKNDIGFSLSSLRSLLQSEFVSYYNPISEYFKVINSDLLGLKKKIVGRDLVRELCKFIHVQDPLRLETQLRKMLVRVIACALNPGVVNKQAFIFVDENQNSGKTTFLRWLIPKSLAKYYTENMSRDKDGLIALGSNLLINLDELSIFSKYEINQLKSIMSAEVIKVRLPYAKSPVSMPRIASFIGSTNKTDFLQDETGNVRWICFELTKPFCFNYRDEISIDELWLYAYQLYLDGFDYQLTAAEQAENKLVNQRFRESTPELEMLISYFEPLSKEEGGEFMTSANITEYLLERTRLSLKPQIMGKALVQMGFPRGQPIDKTLGYGQKGYYVKKIK